MHYYTTVKPEYELSKWSLNERPLPMNILQVGWNILHWKYTENVLS